MRLTRAVRCAGRMSPSIFPWPESERIGASDETHSDDALRMMMCCVRRRVPAGTALATCGWSAFMMRAVPGACSESA